MVGRCANTAAAVQRAVELSMAAAVSSRMYHHVPPLL